MTGSDDFSLDLPILPSGDRVLVAPLDGPRPESGLILPPSASRLAPPTRGVVLAVGEGKVDDETGRRRPVAVPVGGLVAFKKYAGTDVSWLGRTLTVMREHEVLGVFVDDDAAGETGAGEAPRATHP